MPSIIVPARNGPEATSNCLATLLYSVSRLNLKCEFVLVDDASDESERILDVFRQHREAAKEHHTKIIRSRKHQHYTGVFSIGLHFATRDVVFFISNDMVVPPSFLEGLLLVSSLSREFGIVRGTSNYVDSHPEHMLMPNPLPKDFQQVDAFAREAFGAAGCAFVEDNLLSGDAILLKRELIDRIGVLDLRFFGYFGDIDYGMRAQMAGYRLVCAKGAWLFHLGAGHVTREMERSGISADAAGARRSTLVEAAYQEFRSKWNLQGPATWEGGRHATPVDFHRVAQENAGRVSLNCEFPADILSDLQLI